MPSAAKNWIEDSNGNRCSVEYFGSKEAAQAALDSLENCENCMDCSGCSGCSRCSGCSGCSRCSHCSRCSRCSDCSDCSGCSGCSRCSHCSRCSDCSRCSGCSHVAWLNAKENLQAEPSAEVGPPPVPVIPNIHQTVYAAASNPKSLDMSTWHTCKKTHCRAGWVVTLAGEAGKKLEQFFGTPLAAMKIYDASSQIEKVSPVRFFEDNDTALEDMKRLAELEATR